MAIRFTINPTPKPNGRKGKTSTHARQVSWGTYKLDEVCEMISERSAVSSADVKSVLDSFAWVMHAAFRSGYHLELEDLGYFWPSLRTRPNDEGTNIVELDGVNYRCSTRLLKKLKQIELKRINTKAVTDEGLDKRKEKMLEYLQHNETLSPRIYAECTGCTRYRAESELKQFVDEGLLEKVGYRRQTVYLLKKDAE